MISAVQTLAAREKSVPPNNSKKIDLPIVDIPIKRYLFPFFRRFELSAFILFQIRLFSTSVLLNMRVLKVLAGGITISLIFVFGGMFLAKSCLSPFDERFALPPALYFETGGKKILISLIQFNEANSYSYNNGVTYKSISTTYFIQSNNAETGKKIQEKEIKEQDEIKGISIEILGDANNLAWIFAGELLAFDPDNLERRVDESVLERKNPSLKGLFPKERQFYQFNKSSNDFYFTANNGTKWSLDCQTLKAQPFDFEQNESRWKAEIQQLELQQKAIEKQKDSMFMQIRNINSTGEDYYKKARKIYAKRDEHYRKIDSLRNLNLGYQQREQAEDQKRSAVESLNRMNAGYSAMRTNQDTVNGKWYGIYSDKEFLELQDRVRSYAMHEETARRNFYVTSYFKGRANEYLYNKESVVIPKPSLVFLQGGFLLDKNTASPIRLQNPSGFLVVSKDIIGNKGKIILTRISDTGDRVWEFRSGLQEWLDWRLYKDYLYVFGADNEEIGSECNFVQIINLTNGKSTAYDYFEDRVRE